MLLDWLFPTILVIAAVWFVIHQKTKAKAKAKRKPESTQVRRTPEPELEYDLLPSFPVKATLHLWYTDRNGQKTERVVDVQEIGAGVSDNTLVGYCQLRQEPRTFYLHRINQCVDTETGELINDVYQYLRQKYEQSPEYKIDELLNTERDALCILFYVSKADGALRKAERKIIRETCRILANDSRINDEMIDRLIKGIHLLTEPAFQLAVGRLAKRTLDIQRTVLDAAEKMVASDKKIHPAEQAALDYMRKRLPAN